MVISRHNRPFLSELFSFYSAKTLLHWRHLDKYYTPLEQCNSALPRFPRPPGSLGSKTWPRICHLPKDCWRQKTEKQSKATSKQVGIIKANTWKCETPTTRIRFCLKNGDSFSGLAYHPHAFGENGHRKRIFSKTLSTVKIFENAGQSFTCGRMKTEVFEYDDVIHTTSIMHTLWGVLSYSIV